MGPNFPPSVKDTDHDTDKDIDDGNDDTESLRDIRSDHIRGVSFPFETSECCCDVDKRYELWLICVTSKPRLLYLCISVIIEIYHYTASGDLYRLCKRDAWNCDIAMEYRTLTRPLRPR